MFGKSKVKKQQLSPYATRADFCRIFERDMNRLYLLSFLLTGDAAVAKQCFVGGLHISQDGNHVFKEWADAWARRAIILNAIRMIRPRVEGGSSVSTSDRSAWPAVMNRAEMTAILELPAFERFAFVMSVLEGYSDQECSLHLGCTRAEVAAARSRALEYVGKSAELRGNIVSIVSDPKVASASLGSSLQPEILAGLAASA